MQKKKINKCNKKREKNDIYILLIFFLSYYTFLMYSCWECGCVALAVLMVSIFVLLYIFLISQLFNIIIYNHKIFVVVFFVVVALKCLDPFALNKNYMHTLHSQLVPFYFLLLFSRVFFRSFEFLFAGCCVFL